MSLCHFYWPQESGSPAFVAISNKAALRKRQGCGKLDGILRAERNRFHGYLPPVQVAPLSIRDYYALCPLVSPIPAQLPRFGGDDTRSGFACRSHNDLPLGATRRARAEEALQTPPQGDERLMARR